MATLGRLFVILAALSAPAGAVLVPGGGNPRTDCYLEFDVKGREVSARRVECTDGDASCDADGACDGTCRFSVAACLNQRDPMLPDCTPPYPPSPLLRATERGFDQAGLRFPALASSACGAFVGADAPIRGNGRRAGRRIRTIAVSPGRPRRDRDVLLLVCRPRPGGCPTTSTTTTTATTTTTVPQTVLGATADTGIFSGDPDANLGSATEIFVGRDATNAERALVRFDLSTVPATASITACMLQVHVVKLDEAAGPGKIYRVKQPGWGESTATWNRFDGVTPWATPGIFAADEMQSDAVVTAGPDGPIAYAAPTAMGAFTFPDLTPLCQDAVTSRGGDLNLLIKADDDAPGTVAELSLSRHSDSEESERPRLVVAP